MGTRQAPERPGWLVVGAPVVVTISGNHMGLGGVKQTTVATVGAHFFTLTDHGATRFRVGTQDHHEAGSWGRFSQVYPLDSDKARSALASQRRATQIMKARDACDAWSRRSSGQSTELRLAAIKALQAIKD